MKRLLCLSMFVVLMCVPTVNAEVIWVDADRTPYDATWDKVVLKITAFEGSEVPMSNSWVVSMLGTWSANGGISLTGTPSNWDTRTLNDYDSQDQDTVYAKQSWVNFSTKSSDAATRTGTSPYYTSFYEGFQPTPSATGGYVLGPSDVTPGGSWGDGEGYGFDNTLLGVFYIRNTTTNWNNPGDVLWTGTVTYVHYNISDGLWDIPTTVQIAVPEPSTLVLLSCGPLGLLAYAWRSASTWPSRQADVGCHRSSLRQSGTSRAITSEPGT